MEKAPFYVATLMIDLEAVSKSYDGGITWAVNALDLHVAQGGFLVILGESGCGKTTTLKMINRLIELSAGTIRIDGEDISNTTPHELRRRIGYVFQGIGLFPHMSIGKNVAAVPDLLGWDKQQTAERVDELLNLVNLDPEQFRDRLPSELSGGQQQRVGLARGLAARPGIMLMDEPFGALDPLTRDQLQEEYRSIHNNLGLTSVMVTHDMTEALLLADQIAVMKGGDLLRHGTPREMLTDPQHEYVEAMMTAPRQQAQRVESLVNEAA